jgi:hypothetical protein
MRTLSPAESRPQFAKAGRRYGVALESGPFCGDPGRHTDDTRY